jgi:hypothetical protein
VQRRRGAAQKVGEDGGGPLEGSKPLAQVKLPFTHLPPSSSMKLPVQ